MKRERKWRKRLVCAALVLALAGLLSGCGEQQVDYDVDGVQGSEEAFGGIAQYAAETDTRWSESIQLTDSDGKDVTVTISAYPEIPDVEGMCVVEVKEYEFTAENKQKIANALFGDEVYSCTKEVIEDIIEDYAYDMETDIPGMLVESYEEKVNALKQSLEQATEELVPVSDYEADAFIGKAGDFYFRLTFEDYVVTDGESQWTQITDDIKSYNEIGRRIDVSLDFLLNGEEELDEEKWAALEETSQSLLEKLETAGFGNLTKYEDSNDYGFGIDGIRMDSFGKMYEYLMGMETAGEKGYCSSLHESVSCFVYELSVQNPLEVISITQDVPMLPLDQIKKIMISEITENPDLLERSVHGTRVNLRKLELIYFPVSDPENEGCYSYIPAWRLSVDGTHFVVLVNAIDGSVIDLAEELQLRVWE